MESNNAKVKVKGNSNSIYVNSPQIIMSTAIDEITRLMSAGNVSKAVELLTMMGKSISSQHPLFPDWRYQLTIDHEGIPLITHVPMNAEAAKKYPLKGTVSLIIPDEYKKFGSMDNLLRHSYGKQKPLEFDAISLKTMIGEHILEDITTNDERKLRIKLIPEKFPDAKPFKLILTDDNTVILDYVLLAIKEIDGLTLYIDNSNQASSKIIISLKINIETLTGDLNISVSEQYRNDVEANYLLNRFVLAARQKRQFSLRSLETGKDLFKAKEWQIDSRGIKISFLRSFVKLLFTLLKLEEFYNIKFKMPESNFSSEDIDKIEILKHALENKPFNGSFTNVTFHTTHKESLTRISTIVSS